MSTAKPDARVWYEKAQAQCVEAGRLFPADLCAINGMALGVVTFESVIWQHPETGEISTDSPKEVSLEDLFWWNTDYVGYIFTNPRRFLHPVPVSGWMGIYEIKPPEVVAQIEEQIRLLD